MGRATLVVALAAALAVPATAAADVGHVDVRVNAPQVQGEPTSDRDAVFPTNTQNEPAIAVNPLDPTRLVAGANDEQRQPRCGPGPLRGDVAASDCSLVPGVGSSGIYLSDDGGLHWENIGLLDDQGTWAGTGVVSTGDPVLAYGPRPDGDGGFTYDDGARAYYSTSATIPGEAGVEYVVVSYSDDDGRTWSRPVIGSSTSDAARFDDKSWITVDDDPASPHFGNVYLSWADVSASTSGDGGTGPVMVSVSTDGGASFGARTRLSPAPGVDSGDGRRGMSSATGPDGSVYVAFTQGSTQVVVVSRDGGGSWTEPTSIGPVRTIDDPIPGADFRTDSVPVVAADPRAGSTTVHAAWTTRTAEGGRVVVATSSDGGRTWSDPGTVSGAGQGYAFLPAVDVAPDGRVDLGFLGLTTTDPTTFGVGNAAVDAWYLSSPDGRSWSTPTEVSTASSDPAASARSSLARQFWGDHTTLASSADTVWFGFTDSRDGTGCRAVDLHQAFLAEHGLATGEGVDVDGPDPAAQDPNDPSTAPAPQLVCDPSFGNTDIRVSVVTVP